MMGLLLCGQEASRPLCHTKLNILIRNEQELSYLVSAYPLLCMESFITDELTDFIRNGIKREDLADRISAMRAGHESRETILFAIAEGCNYLSPEELQGFKRYLSHISGLSDYERKREEGRALFKAGCYSAAIESLFEALRLLERDFRRRMRLDDPALRKVHEIKADLLLDIASVKLQFFDEKGALSLIRESLEIFKTVRGEELCYLIEGSGDLKPKDKERLDRKKEEAKKKALESREYALVASILNEDESRAKQLASSWKKRLRRM